MSETKKFYWLKLKRDFFKRHDIQIIESRPNGKDYILFYLKLLCESVDHNGNLRFSEEIPYDENMLAVITNTNIDIVRSAIKIFTSLDMMEIMDNGTYYMKEVNKMIGSETEWAEKKRIYREKQKELDYQGTNDGQKKTMSDKSKSIEIEKEIDIDLKENKKEKSPLEIIFDYWNSKNIIKHREINNEIKKAYEKATKDYNLSLNDITLTIDRYDKVIKDKNYYFNYEWTLAQFLSRKEGAREFLDDGSKWVNYQSWLNKNNKPNQQPEPQRYKGLDIDRDKVIDTHPEFDLDDLPY